MIEETRHETQDIYKVDGSVNKEKLFSDHIANNSRSLVSIINRNYLYEKVNKPFCSSHLRSGKFFLGKSLSDVWGHDTFVNHIKKNVDLCFRGRTVRYEASFETPKLGNRYFEVVFRPIRTKRGEVTHIMAETFDITDLKKSRKNTDDLQQEFRLKEIDYENRLLQAQRLETIGVLAGGIAHDFNNILATISGYAEMLQEDLPVESPLAEKTAKIVSAVSRAKSLTNQILTFSRQVEQEKILVNVNDILRETTGFVSSALPLEIKIQVEIPRAKVLVFADPTQLFRVFLNLMTNAFHSMEVKGGTLSVTERIIEGSQVKSLIKKDIVADDYVLLSFKDTGSGMDDSMLQRIFEPFYTTRDIGKGTGLGLSVVHGIVKELEGEIFVTSMENIGSVFDVCLPVSKDLSIQGRNNSSDRKILFIRGNRYESSILSMALRSSGFELVYASSGKQLMKIMSAEKNRPDLIVYMTDSEKVTARDMIGTFKKLEINTPCILITDQGRENTWEEVVKSGIIKNHLYKPVSLKELKNAIDSSLENAYEPGVSIEKDSMNDAG